MELWDVYTRDRVKTGRVIQRGRQLQPGDYHLVTDIWIMDSRGRLLIQQRSWAKESAPGLWCCTGGSVIAGEDSLQGMQREMREELGVPPDLTHSRVVLTSLGTYSLKDIYLVRQDIPESALSLQAEEVIAARWVTFKELQALTAQPKVFYRLAYLPKLLPILAGEAAV